MIFIVLSYIGKDSVTIKDYLVAIIVYFIVSAFKDWDFVNFYG